GDEFISLECVSTEVLVESIPLAEFESAAATHRHKTRDDDSPELWNELRDFLKSGTYPLRLTTDREKLSFLKRARRYLLHQDRLWLAPRKNSNVLPALVIEEVPKRGSLMAQAHNECGHRGRDAVY
ncbi:hypothetical protein DFH09DRAFT_839545, partial [Mycena vulgaris]